MKEEKDEKLNALFKDYISKEDSPSEDTTKEAIEFMRSRREEEVPVAAMAASDGGAPVIKNGRKKYYIVAIAAGFLLLCGMFVFFMSQRGNAWDVSTALGLESVSKEQLDESISAISETSTSDDGFLNFVPFEAVKEYREYPLIEDVGDYGAGDCVIYYVEYSDGGLEVKLYAEAEGICWDELNFYKQCERAVVYSDVTFYYDIDEASATSYAYFRTDSFGYDIEISTADKAALQDFLTKIAKKI